MVHSFLCACRQLLKSPLALEWVLENVYDPYLGMSQEVLPPKPPTVLIKDSDDRKVCCHYGCHM
jgi:hypothetical protein